MEPHKSTNAPVEPPADAYLALIDAWVARAEGFHVVRRLAGGAERFMIATADGEQPVPPYTTSEAHARPIIDREGIEFEPFIDFHSPAEVLATITRPGINVTPSVGRSEIEAGMICYVGMKFGEAPFEGVSPALS